MTDGFKLTTIEDANQLFIHFDVQHHFVKLETFLETARSTKAIIEAYNQEFFDGNLEYQLIVLAPASGSLLSKIGVILFAGAASVFAFVESDIGKAYIKGFTGSEPATFAEDLGKAHKSLYERIQKKTKLGEGALTEEEKQQIGSTIIIDMTKELLEADRDTVNRVLPFGQLIEALDARGSFYEACLADPDVNGVGFDRDEHFPIPRNTFAERAWRIRRDEDTDEMQLPWQVSVESIYVSSPNWDKDDQETRKWKGKDSIRKDCYFIIEDEEFWQHAKDRDLRVNGLDSLKVQWAFQSLDGRPKNRRVLRVLEFNGEVLAKPFDDAAVRAIIGDYSKFELVNKEPSLFEPREVQ